MVGTRKSKISKGDFFELSEYIFTFEEFKLGFKLVATISIHVIKVNNYQEQSKPLNEFTLLVFYIYYIYKFCTYRYFFYYNSIFCL